METTENLDRWFIATLLRKLSSTSALSRDDEGFYEGIANNLSYLKKGWWLESSVDQALTLSKKIKRRVLHDYEYHLRSLRRMDISPSFGVRGKPILMVITCQALHHIDWYGRQGFPNRVFLFEEFDTFYFTREWLRKLLIPYGSKAAYRDCMAPIIQSIYG